MTMAAELTPAIESGVLIGILLWILVAGLIGRAIAKKKGRGTAGFWLGALLGFWGWIIAAFLRPARIDDKGRQATITHDAQVAHIARMAQFRHSAVPAPVIGGFPAAWHPDPTRRFEQRYWDGTRWTASVSRGGLQTLDPC